MDIATLAMLSTNECVLFLRFGAAETHEKTHRPGMVDPVRFRTWPRKQALAARNRSMCLFDRYLILLFARVFVICFLSLLGMYIVADFVNNLNELLDYAKTQGGLLRVLVAYYGPQAPWFFDLISRVVSLIAAVFAVTWLQSNNEMPALMAAGISRWRIIKPLVVAVGVVSGLAALNREIVIPLLRDRLSRGAQNWLGERSMPMHPRYDHVTDIFFDGKGTLDSDQRIELPKFRLPSSFAAFGEQLTAESAFYRQGDSHRPAGYLLTKVTEPRNLAKIPTATLNDQPVIFSPSDTPWLEPDQLFVSSKVPFSHLQGGNSWRQFASTPHLVAGLRNPSLDYGADVSVTIHSRILQPFLDVTLFFLGLPLVLARESRNVFVAAGSCLLMVTMFMIVLLACHAMGMNYLITPALAAWCPLMIFVPLALAMSEPLRR